MEDTQQQSQPIQGLSTAEVNERIAALSHITEGSLHAYEARVKAEREAAEAQGCTGGCDSCGGCE